MPPGKTGDGFTDPTGGQIKVFIKRTLPAEWAASSFVHET
jgi:hypothetical protein